MVEHNHPLSLLLSLIPILSKFFFFNGKGCRASLPGSSV